MALITCPKCKAQVSDEAVACPKCGARLPKQKGPNRLLPVLIAIPLLAIGWASVGSSDPVAHEKADARASILACRDTQKARSQTPGETRFDADSCEKMERDFTAKYGHTP